MILAITAVLLVGALPTARAQSGPALVVENRLPGSNDVKRPHVDTLPGPQFGSPHTILVSGVADRSEARLWAKPDTTLVFPNPQPLGLAAGQPDDTTTSIAVAPDRTIYYAWVNANAGQILLRSRRPNATDFGPTQLIFSSRAFPNDVEVGANEDGVFVFWRLADGVVLYKRSLDGVTWPAEPTRLMPGVAYRRLDVAAGPGRQLIVGYTKGLDDVLQAYVSIWNPLSGSFVEERVPTVTDRTFADPHVAIKPLGGYFVALRSDDSVTGGAWFAERAANGVWTTPGRLVRGRVSSITVDLDEYGNVHLAWIGDAAGQPDLFYAFRRAGGASFEGPLLVRSGALPIFNLQLAAHLRDQSYGHIVAERFTGAGLVTQYYLFGAPVTLVGSAGITIENGAPTTNKPVVSVTFAGVQGDPNLVRWRWGAPPTDQANDSGGYQPFTNPLNVAAPALSGPACTPFTLYTQLRRGEAVQPAASSASIVFDRAVQTMVSVSNPLPAFDPAFTRRLLATVMLNNAAECSGLAAALVRGPIDAPGGQLPLNVGSLPEFTTELALTGDPGVKTLQFVLTDRLGNTLEVERSITYDPVRPVFDSASAALALQPHPQATTLLELTLDNISAGDDKRLFGIVVRPELTPAAGGAPVAGRALVLPFSQMSEVSERDGRLRLRTTINLVRAFDAAQLVPGRYMLAITFADAAGNESLANAVGAVSLERITFPVFQPLALR